MARGIPSMAALLGVLAVAGYQNRDKLAELLGRAGARAPANPEEAGRMGGTMAGTGAPDPGIGGVLASGLRDIVDRFRQTGAGDAAESWVRQGPNQPVSAEHMERAIGEDTLADLSRQTGLSRQALLARLTRNLPEAVDKYTPEGRLPDA